MKKLKWWRGKLGIILISIFYAGEVYAQTSPVSVIRTISPHQIEGGESFEVTLSITVNESVTGLGIDENLTGYPESWPWEVNSLDDDGAVFNPNTVEWLWLALTEGETKKIIYQVKVPLLTRPGIYAISGTSSSELPSFEQPISGDSQVTVWETTAPVITPKSIEYATQGESLLICANISDTSPLSFAKVYYRQGGETSYNEISMELDFQYEATIPAEDITERGLEYYIEAQDIWGNRSTFPEVDPGVSFCCVKVKCSSLSFPFPTLKKKWQMISVPGNLQDPSAESVLKDNLGPPDSTVWKLYHWDTQNKKYEEYPDVPDFTPGSAFWLITKNSKTFKVKNLTSVKTSNYYSLPLSPGWTQIANPFAFKVNWGDVKVEKDGIVLDIINANEWVRNKFWYYIPENNNYGWDIAPEGILEPYKGYWVKTVTSSCTLLIPPGEATDTEYLNKSLSSFDKYLQIIAKMGDAEDTHNFIGFSFEAKDKYDALDVEKAPLISSCINLSFYHPDWGKNSGKYAQDIRKKKNASLQDEQVWSLLVETNQLNKTVTLRWKNIQAIPSYYNLYLEDKEGKILVDMKDKDNYSFYPTKKKCIFKIIATSTPLSLPENFTLNDLYTYPNPTSGITYIHFNLGAEAILTMKIFTLSGELVKTVVYQKVYQSGPHQEIWQCNNERSEPVASGVYILILKAQKEGKCIIKTYKIAVLNY